MTEIMAAAIAFVLAAELEVAAGAPLQATIARAQPGDVVRLGPGVHASSLGRPAGIRIVGAGSGETLVVAPEGEDGAIASGALELASLTLRAGPERCALKVLGGEVRLDDVGLAGGACGAFVDSGRLSASGAVATGGLYGVLVRDGDVSIADAAVRGGRAGVGALGGAIALRRVTVTGPSLEAGISIAGGSTRLDAVVIRSPGPAGIAVSDGARVEGADVTVAGAVEEHGMLGTCVQVIRAKLRIAGATLARCAGAAVEASGGSLRLEGLDASGGSAGCIVLVNGADADIAGSLCGGRGPGLVVASRARARLVGNRWQTDPVASVDCGSGARVEIGRGEKMKAPCAAGP
jgi:hypothetical protein